MRAPLVLVATSELVKLRFVVVQQSQAAAPDAFGYFFWLYCAFVGVQVGSLVAVVSLLFTDKDNCKAAVTSALLCVTGSLARLAARTDTQLHLTSC